jgi:hypothetical protein
MSRFCNHRVQVVGKLPSAIDKLRFTFGEPAMHIAAHFAFPHPSRACGAHVIIIRALMAVLMAAGPACAGPPQAKTPPENKFMNEVNGEFEVKIVPVDTGDDKMGMMILDKHYHGDLNAIGQGRMLTGMTDVKGSAVYVAIERVKGKLHGAEGTFLIHHTGLMARGSQSLVIRVVPDSGSGELAGLDGEMHIKIADGKHFYRFQYTLGTQKSPGE